MSVAEAAPATATAPEGRGRRVPWWPLALGALVLGALILRVVGFRHGLPYVYNADENAHFVPRAIGMFGHTYNPGYFINPPAFTYLLHVAYAVRWGSDRSTIGEAFAADPSTAFAIARAASAVLGAAAVGFLAWAGTRLIDRRAGLIAGALLAVAFLPVHYSHLALNDVPALAPLCLALVGVAGVYRTNRLRDYALAGAALGVACATKYTAGIVLLPLLAAAAVSAGPGGAWTRVRGLALAGVLAVAGFAAANPYALIDWDTFRAGLEQQSEASSDGGGKLGLTQDSGLLYYLTTTTWGLGWLPALAALGGAIGMAFRDRRLFAILVPGVLVFLWFMGGQDRFFARWLLPLYPFLCLLAAWAVVQVAGRRRWVAVAGAALLCAQGLVFSLHNDVVLAREDTRQLARDWMVQNIPPDTKVVVEPNMPHQWAYDPGGAAPRWNKWATSRSKGKPVKLEDYERTLRPGLIGSYARGGYCWVVIGSNQYGRALAEPEEVPGALAYYEELRRRGEQVYRVRPWDGEAVPFSFDFSFNAYPLTYGRPGPEIQIYRLSGGKC
jgi:hypothetical protein